MKKTLLILTCILTLLCLSSCKEEEQDNMTSKTSENTATVSITVTNGVSETDMWILPQTKENLSTSLWGTATVAKIENGESRQVLITQPGDEGFYILRMIDIDGFYYSANGIVLKEGWALKITDHGFDPATADVYDENGDLQNSYEVFSARL